MFCGIFIALLNGITIDTFRYKNVQIEKLYLKYSNGLSITLDKIVIKPSDKDEIDIRSIKNGIKRLNQAHRYITSLHIKEILYKDISICIDYNKKTKSIFKISSHNNSANGEFKFYKNTLYFKIDEFIYKNLHTSIDFHLDIKNDILKSKISLYSQKIAPIDIFLDGDSEKIDITSSASGNIYDIKPIVDIFHLDNEISEWIVDFNHYKYAILEHFSGRYIYNDSSSFLNSLDIRGRAYDVEYYFQKNLEPIEAPEVMVEFNDSKLKIYPKNGYFLTTPTQNSSVTIDFAQNHPMLYLDIKSDKTSLRDDIAYLLQYFDITLPITQLSGYCDSTFFMSIDLQTLAINTKGLFKPTKSTILLSNTTIQSEGGVVELDNDSVNFYGFNAKIDGIYGDVAGKIDTSSNNGLIDIDVKKAEFRNLSLQKPLKLTYIISPRGDSVNVSLSKWLYDNTPINIDAFKMSKNLDTLYFDSAKISNDNFILYANGAYELKSDTLTSKAVLKKLTQDSVSLLQDSLNINISYTPSSINITSNDSSIWGLGGTQSLISPFNLSITDNKLYTKGLNIVFGDLFRGVINANYYLDEKKSHLNIDNINPINQKLSHIIKKDSSIELFSKLENNRLKIDIPALNIHFHTHPKGWKIAIDDISIVSKHIPILNQYKIDNGNLNIYYSGTMDRYTFKGNVNYPYDLLVIENKPIKHYYFSGTYKDNITNIEINDIMDVKYDNNTISIDSSNIGLNIYSLLDFIKDTADSNSTSDTKIAINAKNSYLYLNENKKIISDKIEATIDDELEAYLYHDNAKAKLKMRDGYFILNGSGFNDVFINNLFDFSNFHDGSLELDVKGSKDSFDGLIRIQNTILTDYKILNNTLAFINTVPSLATFSLPNYSSKGLKTKEIYGYFTYNNNVVNVENFSIDSKEIKISGSSIANIAKNTIDGSLNLKTTIGSSIGKIPVMGYILLGEDGSISTTLKISGSLDNPKIDTSIAKESVIAPFNILKRAIIYPFKWMMD